MVRGGTASRSKPVCAKLGRRAARRVALVVATPKGWTEKARFKLPRESQRRLPSGGQWTHPVVANGLLYIRDLELLFCFDLKP